MKQGEKNRRRGLYAEVFAALYLTLKGYRFLTRRYRAAGGEIDLVMKKRQTLVFVEVKTRRTHEEALYSIGQAQQKRIMKAARAYTHSGAFLSGVPDSYQRFDLVTFSGGGRWPLSWPRHIVNAWGE